MLGAQRGPRQVTGGEREQLRGGLLFLSSAARFSHAPPRLSEKRLERSTLTIRLEFCVRTFVGLTACSGESASESSAILGGNGTSRLLEVNSLITWGVHTMSIDNAIASMAVKDLKTAITWYEQLLGKPPDSLPMPEVAEWKFPRGGWLQVYQLPERAGHGSCTLAEVALTRC